MDVRVASCIRGVFEAWFQGFRGVVLVGIDYEVRLRSLRLDTNFLRSVVARAFSFRVTVCSALCCGFLACVARFGFRLALGPGCSTTSADELRSPGAAGHYD